MQFFTAFSSKTLLWRISVGGTSNSSFFQVFFSMLSFNRSSDGANIVLIKGDGMLECNGHGSFPCSSKAVGLFSCPDIGIIGKLLADLGCTTREVGRDLL